MDPRRSGQRRAAESRRRRTQAARREREAAEQEALARVGRLLRFDRMMAQANPETDAESATYSELGFVFSAPEIDRHLHLVERTQQAALAEKCNWNHRKFEEEWQKRAA